jgi:8-oxo-dGTP pyrophosphatase MutT (NUDIX family)
MDETTDGVSAVFLLRPDGATLLQLRDNKPGIRRPGYWVIPGGHCELGETLEECARREFAEETAYICQDLHFLTSLNDEVEGYRYWLHIFWSVYDGQQPIECLEGQELRFVSREQAADYLRIDYLLKFWDIVLEQMNNSQSNRLA